MAGRDRVPRWGARVGPEAAHRAPRGPGHARRRTPVAGRLGAGAGPRAARGLGGPAGGGRGGALGGSTSSTASGRRGTFVRLGRRAPRSRRGGRPARRAGQEEACVGTARRPTRAAIIILVEGHRRVTTAGAGGGPCVRATCPGCKGAFLRAAITRACGRARGPGTPSSTLCRKERRARVGTLGASPSGVIAGQGGETCFIQAAAGEPLAGGPGREALPFREAIRAGKIIGAAGAVPRARRACRAAGTISAPAATLMSARGAGLGPKGFTLGRFYAPTTRARGRAVTFLVLGRVFLVGALIGSKGWS